MTSAGHQSAVSRRTVLKAAAAFAGTAALAGCSTSRSSELVVGYYGTAEELTGKTKLVAEFAKTHPKIRIRGTYADASGFFEKLPLLFRSGGAPDVFFAAESWISGLASLGGYQDIGDRISADGLSRDRWLDGSFAGVEVGKQTLGLPVSVFPRGIAYNKSVFDDRGVDVPEAGWKEADWLKAAKAITNGEGTKRIYGTSQWTGGGALPPYDLVTLYGGMIFNLLDRKMTASDERVVKAVSFVQQWLRELKIAPPAGSAAALATGLPSGRYGMDQFPAYNAIPYSTQIGDKFEWDVVPFPAEWKGSFQNTNVCVFGESQRQDEAWEFAKWAALDPTAQELQGAAATPVEKEAAAKWIAKPPKGFEKVKWQPLVDRLGDQGVAYQGGDFNKIWSVMNNENQKVQIQGADAKQAMRDLDDRGREILSVSTA